MSKNILVTTSIAYVNGAPHLGFAMETIEADVYARWARSRGNNVFFLTGTDEHGGKIDKVAKSQGKETQLLCDENAIKFQKLCRALHISEDRFIRTTDADHKKGVQDIWKKILEKKDLQKRSFEGHYCLGCEAFLTPKDLDESGECPHHKKKPEVITEENYFFLLSRYSKKVKDLLETKEVEIIPEFRSREILELCHQGLHDVSFSRPRTTLEWGVDIPDDPDQVMYVWCDALSNYLTGVGYGKNEDWKTYWEEGEIVHFIGKDILRFHAGIWPGMLLSAELPLPQKICVHGFLTSEGHKMSKSLGNVVDPFAVVAECAEDPDPLRYFLLAEVPFGRDADFSQKRFWEIYNAKLANGLGNVFSRVMTMAQKSGVDFSSLLEKSIVSSSFQERRELLSRDIDAHIARCEFHLAIEKIWRVIDDINEDIDQKKPWKQLKENPELVQEDARNWALFLSFLADELVTFLPGTAKKMKQALSSGESIMLFPRRESPTPIKKEYVPQFSDFSLLLSKEVQKSGVIVDFVVLENMTLKKSPKALQKFLLKEARKWREEGGLENEVWKSIVSAQNMIKQQMGFDPQNFPTAAQKLAGLVEKQGKLPNINTLIDVYNILSLQSGLSFGAHDLDLFSFSDHQGVFGITTGNEVFLPLNTTEPLSVSAGEYAFFTGEGTIGCRFDSQQSDGTKVTLDTKNALIYFQGARGQEKEIIAVKKKFQELWERFGEVS